jgi:hypothetical protein
MAAVFTLAVITVWATAPFAQVVSAGRLPPWVAPYFSTATGSLFPLFPWSAYVLVGSGLGQLYARWGAGHLSAFARWALLVPGAALLMAAFVSRVIPYPEFLADPFTAPPREFVLRTGPCLMMMGGMAYASRRITHLPRLFAAVAQESLLIYFVHLCIVYGSPWNHGLWSRYAASLGPLGTVVAVLFVIVTTTGLAWVWSVWKHTHARSARVMPWLTGAGLTLWLL